MLLFTLKEYYNNNVTNYSNNTLGENAYLHFYTPSFAAKMNEEQDIPKRSVWKVSRMVKTDFATAG